MEEIVLSVRLKNPEGRLVDGIIVILDGYAISKFNDPKLAERLYKMEKNVGTDCFYSKKQNAYLQRYKDMKKEVIQRIITHELEKMGGKTL
jgi:hypothetical protein